MLCYFILQALFQSAQHIYEKRKGSGAGSGSAPLTNGSGSGRPRNMRIPNTVVFDANVLVQFQRPNCKSLTGGYSRLWHSVADPGCLFRIPDPGSDFFPSQIPDPNSFHPGSRIRMKEFTLSILTPKNGF
jgi:hypothetical protein